MEDFLEGLYLEVKAEEPYIMNESDFELLISINTY